VIAELLRAFASAALAAAFFTWLLFT